MRGLSQVQGCAEQEGNAAGGRAGVHLTPGPATLCYVELSYRRTDVNSSGCSDKTSSIDLWPWETVEKARAGKSGVPTGGPLSSSVSQDERVSHLITETQCEPRLSRHIQARGLVST